VAPLLDAWRNVVNGYLTLYHLPARPLAGISVRVRYSHREPYCEIGKTLHAVLSDYGAELKTVDDMSFAMESGLDDGPLIDIDAFVMVACTTGVSADPRRDAERVLERLHKQAPDLS
jgi:hypothetical protein